MIEKINQLLEDVRAFHTENPDDLEVFRIKYLGKKGIMNDLFALFKQIPNNEKKEVGQSLNALKQSIQQKLEQGKSTLSTTKQKSSTADDLSRPVSVSQLEVDTLCH